MQTTSDFIAELDDRISDAQSADDLSPIGTEIDGLIKDIHALRCSIQQGGGIWYEIKSYLEDLEGQLAQQRGRAKSAFDRMLDEAEQEEDDRRYGSYADQVRSTYYGSVL
mgnify:CR=1 FL=1